MWTNEGHLKLERVFSLMNLLEKWFFIFFRTVFRLGFICHVIAPVWSQVDFWLDPVSTELPVDIRVPRSSLSAVTEYLSSYNIPYSVIINNLQVCNPANAVRLSLFYVNLYWYFSGFENACHLQDLLDEEKAEMQMSQMKERSTRSFNFGAYHRLETVSYYTDI